MVKASNTGGVKPVNLGGRLVNVRERMLGMSDWERAYRKQYLKDQILSPNEPKYVHELYLELNNPIRRFYRAPLDAFGRWLEPRVGDLNAKLIRYFTGKLLMGSVLAVGATYYFMYNGNTWMRKSGWRVVESRCAVYEGEPGYPKVSDRTKGADYASRGFKDVTLNLKDDTV